MLTNLQNRWWPRAGTLAIWFLAAASATWWALRLAGPVRPAVMVPPAVTLAAEAAVDPTAVGRLLGASPVAAAVAPAPGMASRFVLLGVVADRSSQGAALIAVDGKPGRPYRVGSKIDEGIVLQAVEPRKARLGPAAEAETTLVLELPPLKK